MEKAAEPASEINPSGSQNRPGEEPPTEGQGGEPPTASYEKIREAALQDFEEPPPEPEEGSLLSLRESILRTLRELRPADRRLLAGGCIVLLALGLFLGAYAVVLSRPPKPVPTQTPTLGVAYPAAITFPGGWDFSLAIGYLQNNKWSPKGSEWLEGTEISRWVSLPWSPQLEAVFRSLKPGDVLDLIMTNSDHLPYRVQSVDQRNDNQIAGINNQIPSLVVFLANDNSKETWVITAVPDTVRPAK